MKANEIREKFLDFFTGKAHTIVSSDSLVPKDDPTVLFTTAGMQQFKRQFLGQIDNYRRAATCQKCLRTDDLDQVGKTPFHHTFFEMLGNFSFGDYFKKEAIAWGWEFLTQVMQIPAEKLWVSVYKDDSEAEAIWLNDIKIPKNKLVKLGDKSNFWPSDAKEKGPNGPCGPCSEIFYDYGVNPNCPKKEKCDPDCNCGRFAEVWNLVFTQFNRKDGGVLEPLPAKNIDTGMGFERLVAVVQGKKSNFETDIFVPILNLMDQVFTKAKCQLPKTERLIVADHIRAVVFGITDGVMPSNEGRGYVIKKLIIDITDLSLRGGASEPVIHKLVPGVVDAMQEKYPEIAKKQNDITATIKRVEEAYLKVRREQIPELSRELETGIQTTSSVERVNRLGQIFFNYRDTHGLTLSTILDTAKSVGITAPDEAAAVKHFESLMEQQKNRSRAASKMTGDVFADADLNLNVLKTQFLGYEQFNGNGRVLKLFLDNKEVSEAQTGDTVKIVLDRTPFYAESGGQVGDTGVMTKADARVRVNDTQKIADVFIHTAVIEQGRLAVGDLLELMVDSKRRLAIMRNHTATHLLQAALRKILGSHVQQQGSLVAPERLRFDFTHPQAISKEQLWAIETQINQWIQECNGVDKKVMSISEAKESGALAFFAEKYGETVRVVSIDGYSKEFCGGTHLNFTGQIGLFKITAESAIAQGIRRLEAMTGTSAVELVHEQEKQLEDIAQLIKAPFQEIVERVANQTQRLKDVEKETEQLRFESIKHSLDELIQKAEVAGGSKIITHLFKNVDATFLRKVADLLKQKSQSSIITLGGETSSNAFILLAVSDDLVKKGIKASELIKTIAPVMGASGGGRPELAQAGSKEVDKLKPTLEQARKIIKESLSK